MCIEVLYTAYGNRLCTKVFGTIKNCFAIIIWKKKNPYISAFNSITFLGVLSTLTSLANDGTKTPPRCLLISKKGRKMFPNWQFFPQNIRKRKHLHHKLISISKWLPNPHDDANFQVYIFSCFRLCFILTDDKSWVDILIQLLILINQTQWNPKEFD